MEIRRISCASDLSTEEIGSVRQRVVELVCAVVAKYPDASFNVAGLITRAVRDMLGLEYRLIVTVRDPSEFLRGLNNGPPPVLLTKVRKSA